ncbi:tyrosine-type recombinase/integrase [Arvimicrobium flavum]|uniref:tyrosine-type recombinase/integrase n=1 Tax=Arvimicrobium flavum TaxID=3393320 RepID=UPI00237A1C12|nr:tyrosine-type recombinase/integrase [Mesorhizobium shangrilense]
MAKTLTESALTTRSSRSKLSDGVHWRRVDATIHLGYRKSKRDGRWIVRWREGVGYKQTPLGIADDVVAEGNLSFDAAEIAARQHVERRRLALAASPQNEPIKVRVAVEEYIARRDARDSKRAGKPVRSDASRRLSRYILGQPKRGKRREIPPADLADIAMHELDEKVLKAWMRELPPTLKETTVRRLANDLKAALNSAYSANHKHLPAALPSIIKRGLLIHHEDDDAIDVARENQVLTDAKVSALVAAAKQTDMFQDWDGDLYRLVLVMAATGARYSQCARIRVADCQVENGRILVPSSRKGKGAKAPNRPVPIGPDVLDELRTMVTDRNGNEPLLERWRKRQTGPTTWEKVNRGPWGPNELNRPWKDVRDRAELPGVIPYALRHSSIVRGLRANLPIRLVAALHDTSVAMIERHYGRYIADGLEELAAKAVVQLVM